MSTTTIGNRIEQRAKWDGKAAEMARYIRSCRNAEKRAYAEHFTAFLLRMSAEPDTAAYGLSYRGTQAVRMSLCNIFKGAAS